MIVSSGTEGQVSEDLSSRTRSIRRESRSVRSARKKESQRQRRSPRNDSGTLTRNRRTAEVRDPEDIYERIRRELLVDFIILIEANTQVHDDHINRKRKECTTWHFIVCGRVSFKPFCMHARLRACVRACVRACARASVRLCVCASFRPSVRPSDCPSLPASLRPSVRLFVGTPVHVYMRAS